MLTCAGLPVTLWGEAVMAVSYIRNRTPIGPKGLTPEEAYIGKKPSVSHLRAWGCVAYANIAPPQRYGDKLAQNELLTALVGYMPTSKQYRLYDPVGDRILISTTPTFHEGRRLRLPGIASSEPRTIGFDPMEADPPPQGRQDKTTPAQPKDSPAGLPGSGASTQNRALEAQGAQKQLSLAEELSPTTADTQVINGSGSASGVLTPAPETERSHMRTPESDSPDDTLSVYDDSAESDDEEAEIQLLEAERATHEEHSPTDEPPLRRSVRVRKPTQRFEGAYTAFEKIENPKSFTEAINDRAHGDSWAQAVK
jgi:hypothetical protein